MLALETFGGLDSERLAVAIRARRTINRDFELRARRLRERPQFRSACHRHFPLLQPSSASRFTAGVAGVFFILSQSGTDISVTSPAWGRHRPFCLQWPRIC